ncbi:MAG: hypothetical protein QXU40_00950 [Candidatus Pacearchaeota archaeon]
MNGLMKKRGFSRRIVTLLIIIAILVFLVNFFVTNNLVGKNPLDNIKSFFSNIFKSKQKTVELPKTSTGYAQISFEIVP